MTELVTPSSPKRPEFRNINAFTDLPKYRWPLASIVSGMHRASGAIMFLLMPFIIWMFDTSLSSELSFARFSSAFTAGVGFVPGVLVKVVVLGLILAYLHHFFAGLRHIRMDIFHTVSKQAGFRSARRVLWLLLPLTVVFGAQPFGWY